ncbi:hypothetical protein CJF32_00002353 [Rutstroemia sp. NJR-2017a WRK4]|nr:hypothetical protein CJF32_00002206 [Rutstroemia sp. NJR-2017a WRK4]PQE14798.1 hypothetical protein CJF32_00002353 [Rutstroemia sp. NJR-2017a WRK4]
MRRHLFLRLSARPSSLHRGLKLPRQSPAVNKFFHASSRALAVKPFLLADIGEGIRECEIIQWFVEPEARVEEWDKLCEVQSDKASVEITSRFAGVIKKLHYEAGEMAQVGKPLLDIDIQGEIKQEDLDAIEGSRVGEESKKQTEEEYPSDYSVDVPGASQPAAETGAVKQTKGKHAALATPAVRHLTKELDVNILDVTGTGKDGRVLKEDIHQFAKQRAASSTTNGQPSSERTPPAEPLKETIAQLTPTQHQMFKTMTKSLNIPHFLYADEIDFTRLSQLRERLNKQLSATPINNVTKISYLPFIIKAVSLTLQKYPILNARLDIDPATQKPVLVMRPQHNIGVAMDTSNGLLVPVIKSTSTASVLEIASSISQLQSLASTSSLTSTHLSGGTITVSNIGNIGGTYVAPVLVETQLAILGIGKLRTIPAFNSSGDLIQKKIMNFSWSADHRVIDGATMARAAEMVRGFVEDPESMLVHLR